MPHLLGEILRDEGEYDEAASLLKRSIEISARNQWLVRLGATLHSLGDLELDRGRLEDARTRYRESLRGAVEAGIDRHEVCIAGLAAVAARRGDPGLAARLWSAVELAETQLGVRLLTPERDRYERCLDGVPRWAGEPLDLEAAVEFALSDESNAPST